MIKIEPLSFCASMIDYNSVLTDVKTIERYKHIKYKTATGDYYEITIDTNIGKVVRIQVAD